MDKLKRSRKFPLSAVKIAKKKEKEEEEEVKVDGFRISEAEIHRGLRKILNNNKGQKFKFYCKMLSSRGFLRV